MVHANAAVSLDRTRVIYPGDANSLTLSIRNYNKTLPYLAQAWLEDADGKKINSPFTVLPPLQRLEPNMESLVKIKSLAANLTLPQDKETLFYFNLREIPPRSKKPNTLQLAMQTRVKFFYRPKNLLDNNANNKRPWQDEVTLDIVGNKYKLINPTPYFVTIVDASKSNAKSDNQIGFNPVMIAPNSFSMLNLGVDKLGKKPKFIYIDDYGGRHKLSYTCEKSCSLDKVK